MRVLGVAALIRLLTCTLENIVQGHLVNGSLGKVTEFLTTSEAVKRNIAISTMDRKGEKHRKDEKPTAIAPPVKDLVRLNGRTFGKNDLWPLVKFTNGMELVCAPVDFSVEGLVGNVEALRLQTPLILAWALSIHKSQGQTLSRVKVDLDRIFEKGQGRQKLAGIFYLLSFVQHTLRCLGLPLWRLWKS